MMKCPKCGYIGFERADKCRNCGYDFSLLIELPPEIDLPLKADEPLGPLSGDVAVAPGHVRPRALHARSVGDDLPLFGFEDQAARLPAQTPGARGARPVTPPSPRLRPRVSSAEPRPRSLDLGVEVVPTETRPEPGPAVRESPDSKMAGPVARAIAGVIDALILGGLDVAVLYFTLRVCRLSFSDLFVLPFAPLIAFFLLLDGAYLVAFTASGGQTIGKMATSIRVTGEEDDRVELGQAIIRAFGYFASAFPAGLGFIPGLFGPSRRALHDRLANTRVVRV